MRLTKQKQNERFAYVGAQVKRTGGLQIGTRSEA